MIKSFCRLANMILFTFAFASCSSLDFGHSSDTVPKEQYDELLKKYKSLARVLRGGPYEVEDGTLDGKKTKKVGSGVETVDLFPRKKVNIKEERAREEKLFKEFDLLGQIKIDIADKQMDKALQNLKTLEKSKNRQVVVRAKMLIGEIFYQQKEYDLSMQVFDEVVQVYTFSGLVLKALDRLVLCSEALGQEDKKNHYHSIRHDFFGS